MARIKIKDLPRDMKITKDELKRVRGGYGLLSSTSYSVVRPIPEVGIKLTMRDFGGTTEWLKGEV